MKSSILLLATLISPTLSLAGASVLPDLECKLESLSVRTKHYKAKTEVDIPSSDGTIKIQFQEQGGDHYYNLSIHNEPRFHRVPYGLVKIDANTVKEQSRERIVISQKSNDDEYGKLVVDLARGTASFTVDEDANLWGGFFKRNYGRVNMQMSACKVVR